MKDGYIPISRKLFEHPFWCEKRVFSYAEAWIDLLRLVRFEASTTKMLVGGKMVEYGRGEYPASLRYLAELWTWSKNKVDNFLNLLISEGMITKRTAEGTNKTIITICNYDDYNIKSENKGQLTGQTKDKVGTSEGQERDNTNKENNIIISLSERVHVCERLGELYYSLLSDAVWGEPLMMNNHISPSLFNEHLIAFFGKLQNESQINISEQEIKQYFPRWLSIEINKPKSNKSSKKSNFTNHDNSKEYKDF